MVYANVKINETPFFSIFNNYSNFMNIHPVGADMCHADGHTWTDKLTHRQDIANNRFSQFCKGAYKLLAA
jgi:hypothetical protein